MDNSIDVSARIHVRFAWAMAPLAAGPLRRFLARGDTLEVWVLVKVVPDLVVFVAVPAPHVASKFSLRANRIHGRRREGLKRVRTGGLPGHGRNRSSPKQRRLDYQMIQIRLCF